MSVGDYTIKCSRCGGKMGIVSLVYFGVPHNTGLDEGCCIKCLPERIKELEAEGYNVDSVKQIKDWLNSPNDPSK